MGTGLSSGFQTLNKSIEYGDIETCRVTLNKYPKTINLEDKVSDGIVMWHSMINIYFFQYTMLDL